VPLTDSEPARIVAARPILPRRVKAAILDLTQLRKRMSFADGCSAAGFLRPPRPLEEGQRVIGRLTTSGLPLRAAATLADHSHRADNRAASSSRTFLVRFIEGGAVECSEGSLDRPGQGRAMDVG
jgi:hypothetical protein